MWISALEELDEPKGASSVLFYNVKKYYSLCCLWLVGIDTNMDITTCLLFLRFMFV